MFFPLSHQEQQARRWPWVTTAIIALNLALHLMLWSSNAADEERLIDAYQDALTFAHRHPNAKRCEELKGLGDAAPAPDPLKSLDVGIPGVTNSTSALREELARTEQEAMDALCVRLRDARSESVVYRFGYVPAQNNWLGLVTYQFLHGGVLHVVFNMWFLWLSGTIIEDAWGRLMYPAFYLAAGVFAALVHKALSPLSPIPLIGASGAVAGAMGAFAFRNAKTNINVLAWIWLRPFVFSAPAWVLLPLWAAGELFWALLSDPTAGGTAYWAHVGGFVFGLAFAVGMRFSGLEKRIDDAIENQDASLVDPRLASAMRLIDEGQAPRAIPRLEALAREEPFSIEVQLALLDAAERATDRGLARRTRVRLIELYQRMGQHDAAGDLFEELERAGEAGAASARARLRLGEHLGNSGRVARAEGIYQDLYADGFATQEAAEALVTHAELMLRAKQPENARSLFEAARHHATLQPDSFSKVSTRIQVGLNKLSQLPASTNDGFGGLEIALDTAPEVFEVQGNSHLPSAPPSPTAGSSVVGGQPVTLEIDNVPASLRDLPPPSRKR
ncbi:MAG: rhomboid family intramembrane serine protease [Polyangiaceae bacterium]|nr:rhomboid family intramembrane serine protease [Myxococcales bacterium]MCB9585539.1 rhomboid family intramembrane serine protease [Polyangiaceae bacterium]MCB9606445.1 rhomboid family intramembrane serine protease [Polyangiaceae bacterium]